MIPLDITRLYLEQTKTLSYTEKLIDSALLMHGHVLIRLEVEELYLVDVYTEAGYTVEKDEMFDYGVYNITLPEKTFESVI
jgi:hypothetical protein